MKPTIHVAPPEGMPGRVVDDPLQVVLADTLRRQPPTSRRQWGEHQHPTVTKVLNGDRAIAGTLVRCLRALITRALTLDEANDCITAMCAALETALRGEAREHFHAAPRSFEAAQDAEQLAQFEADLALVKACRRPGVGALTELHDKLAIQAQRTLDALYACRDEMQARQRAGRAA